MHRHRPSDVGVPTKFMVGCVRSVFFSLVDDASSRVALLAGVLDKKAVAQPSLRRDTYSLQ